MYHSSGRSAATAATKSSESAFTANTLRVMAPATLQEGYQFDVMLQDRKQPFTVTVPRGGVREGQEFEIPLPAAVTASSSSSSHETAPHSRDDDDDNDRGDEDDEEQENYDEKDCEYGNGQDGNDYNPSTRKDAEDEDDDDDSNGENVAKPPTGKWRRSLCGCCGVLTQATFWMGTICTPILVGQLLTRLRLDWLGHETNNEDTRAMTFNRIVMSAIAVLLLGYIPVVGAVIVLLYWVTVVVCIGTNLRTHMRRRYRIPAPCCPRICDGKCNDGLTMLLCGCCATIQMARHTHSDLEFPGYCCTTTGLPADAPALV
jgi:Cys-rich protein (TIGR01571 family)